MTSPVPGRGAVARRRVERAIGVLEVVLGVALLAVGVWGFVPAIMEHWSPPPPTPLDGEVRHGNGNWAWGLTIFLIPPGAVLVVAGAVLVSGARGRWWLQLLAGPILLAAAFLLGLR